METYTRDSDGKKFKVAEAEIEHCCVCEGTENLGRCPIMCGGTFETSPLICKDCQYTWYDTGETDPVKLKALVLAHRKPIEENPMPALQIGDSIWVKSQERLVVTRILAFETIAHGFDGRKHNIIYDQIWNVHRDGALLWEAKK